MNSDDSRKKASFTYNASPTWGEQKDSANQIRINKTISLIPPEVKSILDVGCGDGAVTNSLVNSYDVTGIDVSEKALKHFKGKAHIGSLEDLPFPNKSFDLIISAEVLEHLPVSIYQASLKEMQRVAKAYIIVSTPAHERLETSFVDCFYCGCVFHRNHHVRTYDAAAHKQLFPDFLLLKTIQIETFTLRTKLSLLIQHNLFGIYLYNKNAVCPLCSTIRPATRQSKVQSAVLLFSRAIDRIYMKKMPRWIASLFIKNHLST